MRKTNLGDVEKQLSDEFDVYAFYYRDKSPDGRTPTSCRVWLFPKGTKLDDVKGVGAGKSNVKPIASGDSYCHPNDNFWKKKGRHIAVCRAAKSAGLI